jgi:hypothetical protein
MLVRSLARPALPALCALVLAACSGGDRPAAPSDPLALELKGNGPTLFGLGGAGHGCRSAEYRQFDFWVGGWQVPSALAVPSADFITSALDGCAILEDWHGAGGSHGRSLSSYDPTDNMWHQQWVENFGFFPLRLDGAFMNGQMVMTDTYPNANGNGQMITNRYTWTALDADDVSQFVETSIDGGPFTGGTLFYHRSGNPSVPPSNVYHTCTSTDPGLALFQEFNFTVGQWIVTLDGHGSAEARSAGGALRSDIRADLDGCLIEEKLTGPKGYEARVFTNLRAIDEIWRRTYQDNRGLRVYVTGPRIQDGKIILTGTMPGPGGRSVGARVTFQQTAGGFTQRWERENPAGRWEELVTASYERQ